MTIGALSTIADLARPTTAFPALNAIMTLYADRWLRSGTNE